MSAFHNERAEKKGHHREYWSNRYPKACGWGSIAKKFTHRYERRSAKRQILAELE